MQSAKSGKAPARAKAGEKRAVVLPGRSVFMAVAGLLLAVSVTVLASVLFGPVPPVPSDHPASVSKTGSGQHAAAPAKKHERKGHVLAQHAENGTQRGDLPFEEHLAPRGPDSAVRGNASEVRGKVEAPAPPAPVSSSDPATITPEAHPVSGDAGKGPRMVVIIDDIGDHPVLARNLVDLPFPVTLAILPNRPRTRSIEAMAASHGLELLLHQPMQPGTYPRVNPGPGAVFTDMNAEQVKTVLTENLSQVPHVVGINNHMGSAFTSDPAGMAAVMQVLKAKGLFFMDSVTSAVSAAPEAARKAGVPFYRRAVFLDNVRNVRTILGQLKTAERHALKHGRAIAIGHPYGETLEALKIWAKERDSHITVVTLTELGPEF